MTSYPTLSDDIQKFLLLTVEKNDMFCLCVEANLVIWIEITCIIIIYLSKYFTFFNKEII